MSRDYTQEAAIADKECDIYISRVAGPINENMVTQLKVGKGIGLGKEIFMQNCIVCHGPLTGRVVKWWPYLWGTEVRLVP